MEMPPPLQSVSEYIGSEVLVVTDALATPTPNSSDHFDGEGNDDHGDHYVCGYFTDPTSDSVFELVLTH